jgi:hypothetical protein
VGLFIPTTSTDGTCDVLVGLFEEAGVPAFRWNVDLWEHYEVRIEDDRCEFADPTGRLVDLYKDDVFLLWRKPFVELATESKQRLSSDNWAFAKSELRQILVLVDAIFKVRKRAAFIEPYADRRLPKLLQLKMASAFFDVPPYAFSVRQSFIDDPIIIKPLGDPQIGQKIFYTTKSSSASLLRPFPWFVQEAIVEGTDITCVYLGGEVNFFRCAFNRSPTAIDWRKEIGSEKQSSWYPIELGEEIAESTRRLMATFDLDYGRLDFIKNGAKLYFLECNSNGQFGWLDDSELRLHRRFAALVLERCQRLETVKVSPVLEPL